VPAVALALAGAALAACDTPPLDPNGPSAPDAGAGAVTPAAPPVSLTTLAGFDQGLLGDLAGVGPEWRTRNDDVAIEGLTVSPGYGVDLVQLASGFTVANDGTLAFGGQSYPASTQRTPYNQRALETADRLWTALAGATETFDQRGVTRTTPAGRVTCSRIAGAVAAESAHCVLTGLKNLGAFENQP
jgi:hypothetical protein